MPKGRGRKDSDSDVASEEQSTVGTFETLRDEGEHFVHVKQYQKAIESFSKALEMKPGDKTCLVTRSKCYLMLGNSQAALADAEAALDQDEEGKKDIRERLEDQWLALCMKAEALYQKGDFETALVYYHRGNKLRPELQEFRLGIQKSQEAINNSIGTPDAVNLEASGDLSFFFKQEEKQKQQQQKGYSKPQTQKREEKKERGKPQGTGSSKTTKELLGELYKDRAYLDKLYDSLVSNNTDTDEYIKGRAVDGLEYLNTRADFWRQQKPMYARKRDRQRKQMKNGKENDPMEYILEQLEEIDEAQAKGEYEKSLKKSQNTLKKIDSWGNDRVKNKPALVANLYSCMGNANLELGKFKEALEHHKKDLSIGEDENIEEAVSRALDNLGRTKARMGKYEDAIEIWEKKVPKSKSALERTWLYHEIGRCYLELGRYGDAKDYGEKSFSAAKEADDHGWQLHASVLVAQAEVKCEKLEAAVDSFERAKEIAEELKDHSAEMAIKKALEEVKSRIVEGERSKTKVDDDDADDDDRRSIKSDGSGGSQKRGQELKKGDEDRDGDPGEKDAKDKANEEMRDNKNEEELEDAHHEQAAKEETDAPTMQAEDNTEGVDSNSTKEAKQSLGKDDDSIVHSSPFGDAGFFSLVLSYMVSDTVDETANKADDGFSNEQEQSLTVAQDPHKGSIVLRSSGDRNVSDSSDDSFAGTSSSSSVSSGYQERNVKCWPFPVPLVDVDSSDHWHNIQRYHSSLLNGSRGAFKKTSCPVTENKLHGDNIVMEWVNHMGCSKSRSSSEMDKDNALMSSTAMALGLQSANRISMNLVSSTPSHSERQNHASGRVPNSATCPTGTRENEELTPSEVISSESIVSTSRSHGCLLRKQRAASLSSRHSNTRVNRRNSNKGGRSHRGFPLTVENPLSQKQNLTYWPHHGEMKTSSSPPVRMYLVPRVPTFLDLVRLYDPMTYNMWRDAITKKEARRRHRDRRSLRPDERSFAGRALAGDDGDVYDSKAGQWELPLLTQPASGIVRGKQVGRGPARRPPKRSGGARRRSGWLPALPKEVLNILQTPPPRRRCSVLGQGREGRAEVKDELSVSSA